MQTHRLQGLLDVRIESATLDRNDLLGGIGVVGDGGAALGAEQAMHVFARAAGLCVALDGAGEVHLVLGDDADQRYRSSQPRQFT